MKMNIYKEAEKETNGKTSNHELINDARETENPIKVSIIVPVCNVERYLSECLDSVIHRH